MKPTIWFVIVLDLELDLGCFEARFCLSRTQNLVVVTIVVELRKFTQKIDAAE